MRSSQSRFAFARIIAAAGPAITKFIPALMVSMITSCKPDELADFINFLGLIVHKLQVCTFPTNVISVVLSITSA
jgi:exportin-T